MSNVKLFAISALFLISHAVVASPDPLNVQNPKTPAELHYFLANYALYNGVDFFSFATALYESDSNYSAWSKLQEASLTTRILASGGMVVSGGCKSAICVVEARYPNRKTAADAGSSLVKELARSWKTDANPLFSAAVAKGEDHLVVYAFSLEDDGGYVSKARAQLKKPASML